MNYWVLGLNSAGFNTASGLLKDGIVVSAVEEERLVREKRTRKFPSQGIQWQLKQAGIRFEELSAIAIGWNPAINIEAHNAAQSARARYLGELFYSVPSHLMALQNSGAGPMSEQLIHLASGNKIKVHYIRHHLCHASSFFFSPFQEAAILTADAFGEAQTSTFSVGKGNRLETIWSQEFPHSLGGYYSALTEFLGFEAQNDEWKLMGASSYGDAKLYLPKLRKMVKLDETGFELDLSYFNFYQFHRPGRFTPKLAELVGIPANEKGRPLSDAYYDLAAAAQTLFEEIYIHLLRQLQKRTALSSVVISGGCALNCVANGKVLTQTNFKDIFVPPVPDDSGCSLGAAFYVHNHLLGGKRDYSMTSNYLGPAFSELEILETLRRYKIVYERPKKITSEVAKLISQGKIIGWFQGSLEFGDRALGNRSIVADPRDASMKDRVNETVKYREPFRPFAPSILVEAMDDYFFSPVKTPFMEKTFLIRDDRRTQIPAVTHVDGTGRLQTVTREHNPIYYELISEFNKITGVPLILNTSFNLKGEAMVCSPTDAVRTFFSSGLDYLAIGPFLVGK